MEVQQVTKEERAIEIIEEANRADMPKPVEVDSRTVETEIQIML